MFQLIRLKTPLFLASTLFFTSMTLAQDGSFGGKWVVSQPDKPSSTLLLEQHAHKLTGTWTPSTGSPSPLEKTSVSGSDFTGSLVHDKERFLVKGHLEGDVMTLVVTNKKASETMHLTATRFGMQ